MRLRFVVPRAGMRVGRGLVLASVVFLSLPTAGAQTPQTPPPDTSDQSIDDEPTPVTAQEWFRRGENVYRVGRYQDAIDAWLHAYALDPRPRIQYNLAQAYERMGRLEDAVAALEQYLANGDSNDLVYADANARLSALRQRIESTGILLRGGPNGGEITIDGNPWGVTPRPDRIGLTPGSHSIDIRYPDGRSYHSTVATPAGQVVTVDIHDSDIATPEIVRVETRAEPSRAMLFTGAGMAGVGAAMLIYGIERQVKVGTCQEADNYCENLSAGQTQRSVGLGIGSTLMVAGGALIVVDLLRHNAYEDSVSLTCSPLLAGASCRLRF